MKNRTYIGFIIHAAIWVTLFLFPILLIQSDSQQWIILFTRNVLPITFCAALFYLNYFLLVDALLFRKQPVLFFLINVALVLLSVFMAQEIKLLVNTIFNVPPKQYSDKYLIFYKQAFTYMLSVSAAISIRVLQRWRSSETDRKSMENEKLKSELNSLRYQLNPHFLLNTLNTIYYLTDKDTEKAKETIHSLGKMMRYILYETTNDRIGLKQELKFLENYISIIKLRLRKDVTVSSSIPEAIKDSMIEPFLFIPLIENAFKHGISSTQASFIDIQMKVDERSIRMVVCNTYFPKTTTDKSGSGIGIENLKRRLTLLYPSAHIFKQDIRNDLFYSELTLSI